jgi:hypothetical protein
MIINNFSNNYTSSSYNMQQKVDIMHSIRIETSYIQFLDYLFLERERGLVLRTYCLLLRKRIYRKGRQFFTHTSLIVRFIKHYL